MRGISFINDPNGRPMQAVVDVKLYGDLFQEFLNKASQREAQLAANPPVPANNASAVGVTAAAAQALIVQAAKSYFGTPHRIGGLDKAGIDCSGLTTMAFLAAGIKLPRSSKEQSGIGVQIPFEKLKVGDLVFFASGAPGVLNHVGVVNNDTPNAVTFIHASTSKGVMESPLQAGSYWLPLFLGAKRVLSV